MIIVELLLDDVLYFYKLQKNGGVKIPRVGVQITRGINPGVKLPRGSSYTVTSPESDQNPIYIWIYMDIIGFSITFMYTVSKHSD